MCNHHKFKRHGNEDAPYGAPYQGDDSSAQEGCGTEHGASGEKHAGMGQGHGSPGHGNPGYGNPGNANSSYGYAGYGEGVENSNFWQGMSAYLPARHLDQFLIGAALGAGAAWVLSDEELRGKMIKAGMKLYANIAGSFEEFKEQMADIRAEVDAERHGDE